MEVGYIHPVNRRSLKYDGDDRSRCDPSGLSPDDRFPGIRGPPAGPWYEMSGRYPAPDIRSEPTDRIERALDPGSVGEVRALLREYASRLGFSLEFQGFDRELARLPGEYAPPSGALFLARVGRDPAGCVAVRDLGDRTCEMKRLFVRPGYRGRGLGRRLAERAIVEGRRLRYARMRLDTVAGMTEALALYRDLGFRAIAAYRFNPRADAAYFELELE